jgi:hypothetical protein
MKHTLVLTGRELAELLEALEVQAEAVRDEVRETTGKDRRRARDYHKFLVKLHGRLYDKLQEGK